MPVGPVPGARHSASRGPRPPAIIGGAALIFARVAAGVTAIVTFQPDAVRFNAGSDTTLAVVVVGTLLGGYAVVLAVQLLCAWLVLQGRNWARGLVMIMPTLSITASFLDYWNDGAPITFATSLPGVTVDILILLALSSTAARSYARAESG